MPRTSLVKLVDATRPRPVETTMRRHVARAARRTVIGFLLFAAPVVAAFAFIPGNDFGIGTMDMVAPEQGAVAIDQRDRDAERAARLVERHDCWTDSAPAGVIPGSVVLAERGDRPRYYSSDEIVGGALDHLFVETDPDIVTVFGFCR